MEKKIKLVFIVSMVIFIAIIFIINMLIKKYEKAPLTFAPQKAEEPAVKQEGEEIKIEEAQTPGEEREFETPVEPGPLVN